MIRDRNKLAERVNAALVKNGLKPLAEPWPVVWERMRRGGLGSATSVDGRRIVKISEKLCNTRNPKPAERTYMHELIHHALSTQEIRELHGDNFRRVAFTLGLRDYGDNTWRWKQTCPVCGSWVKLHTKEKRRVCWKCPSKKTVKRGKLFEVTILERPLMRISKIFELKRETSASRKRDD